MTDPSPFATPTDDIRQAFAHVVVPCSLNLDLYDILMESFVYAHQSGNPKLEPLALMMLSESVWSWPWFDDWYAAFQETNQWPHMWKAENSNFPHIERYSATRQLRLAKVHLLAHTLTMVAFRIRDFTNKRPYLKKWGWQISQSIGCDVEDSVKEDYAQTINIDDWKTWPPFFPGDRTNLMGMKPSSSTFGQDNRPPINLPGPGTRW